MDVRPQNERDAPGFLTVPPVRYPNEYLWLLFVSALDAILTWVVIFVGGTEANPIPASVLAEHGWLGLVVYKFSLMTFVIVACEIVGRSRERLARGLARFGVVLSALPSVVSFSLLIREFSLS